MRKKANSELIGVTCRPPPPRQHSGSKTNSLKRRQINRFPISPDHIVLGLGNFDRGNMAAAHKIAGHATYAGPSVIKEIIYVGISLGLIAGGLWKVHHWRLQKRRKEFYDVLDRGVISVVVEQAEE
ncbi:hypothetical protein Taro_004911 [Colocasia esculenta]|uniref:Cytochrome c oxidase subunit 5C n=1 Tax=Colocasia esculenta TaxID=4460 RepID=A0A843TLN2_COLES|nr:hypothetical protein [Colocasia esculenta]